MKINCSFNIANLKKYCFSITFSSWQLADQISELIEIYLSEALFMNSFISYFSFLNTMNSTILWYYSPSRLLTVNLLLDENIHWKASVLKWIILIMPGGWWKSHSTRFIDLWKPVKPELHPPEMVFNLNVYSWINGPRLLLY